MTARNNKRKAALAVTAGLVSALSLGGAAVAAAPVTAYAEASLESLAPSTDTTQISATDGTGNSVASISPDETVELDANSGQYLSLNVPSGWTVDYYAASGNYKATGDSAAKAFFTGRADRTNPGQSYYAVVTQPGKASVTYHFTYVDKQAADYVVFNDAATGTDGTSFTYDGTAHKVAVRLAGSTTESGNDSQVTVTSVKNWRGETVNTDGGQYIVKYAGDYTVNFTVTTSNGTSAQTKDYTIKFSVGKLDLSELAASYEDFQKDSSSEWDATAFLKDFVGNPVDGSGTPVFTAKLTGDSTSFNKVSGPVTVEVGVNDKASEDARNSVANAPATVEYTVLDGTLSGSAQYGQYANQPNVNVAAGAFDESLVKYVATDETVYSGDKVTVSYWDNDNNEAVDASALKTAGNYTVTVTVKPFQANGKWYGGSASVNIQVSGVKLDANKTLTFTQNGEVVAGTVNTTYDRSDVLKTIGVEVKDSDGKTYAEGTDYKLVVKDSSGNEVTEAVDAGDYTVEVVPLTFQWTNSNVADYQLKLSVAKFKINSLKDYTSKKDASGKVTSAGDALTYTGEDIDLPGVVASDAAGNSIELNADEYDVKAITFEDGKRADALNAAGSYTVDIALTDAGAKNFQIADTDFDVDVLAYRPFSDVKSTDWFAKDVNDAAALGYMTGYAGTDTFGPTDTLSRAQAVQVLFNMAGGTDRFGDEFHASSHGSYDTGFDDTDDAAWYAQAVAWAKAYGVVSGYDGTNDFGPDDAVTREQFARMLANYAAKTGQGDADATDDLSAYKDASSVSGWATDDVEWAVANGVLGQNVDELRPQDSIQRAEVAAMAVRFQPTKFTGTIIK